MSYNAYYLSPEGTLGKELSEKEIKTAFESKQGLLWVDVAETTEEDGSFLERVFNFHHLAVEDCVSTQIHPPKIDDFGDYIFLVVHGINHVTDSDIVETTELAIFIGSHFVVSNHTSPLFSIEHIRRMVEDDCRPMKRGADFLAHALIDTLVDNVLPTIDKMGDVADEIDEEVIRNPQQPTLEDIMKLKRSILKIHRVMAPQREVLNQLSRRESTIIRDEVRIFYRDIYDHIVRIEDLNQTLHDRADNALATYLSSVANRQNEVMKVLSMVATIFLPLALLAGVFGMNFEYMPELGVKWAYFAVVGFMAVAIVVAVWWFWARRWLGRDRRHIARLRPFVVERERLKGYLGHRPKKSPR
jgi:magnesium transporter